MRNRLLGIIVGLLLVITSTIDINAVEPISVNFTTEGKLEYKNENQIDSYFNKMLPSEVRSLCFTLNNNYDKATNFYISTGIIQNFKNQKSEGGAYDLKVALEANGVITSIYDSTVGGSTISQGSSIQTNNGLVDMTALEDKIFLTQLAKGQSAKFIYNLKLEGESNDNSYMDAEGILNFQFFAAYQTGTEKVIIKKIVTETGKPKVVKRINNIILAAKTGDFTLLPIFGLLFVAAIILLVATRKKKGDQTI